MADIPVDTKYGAIEVKVDLAAVTVTDASRWGKVLDRPSAARPGEGVFSVSLRTRGFLHAYSRGTKKQARENVKRWLVDNARPR